MRANIKQRIAEKIASLGSTKAEIARSLASTGVRGKRQNAQCCVLANYIKREFPEIKDIHVSTSGIGYHLQDGFEVETDSMYFDNPAVSILIQEFDRGELPKLEEPVSITGV